MRRPGAKLKRRFLKVRFSEFILSFLARQIRRNLFSAADCVGELFRFEMHERD